ncbi:MAG TPA: BBE domain-containing protein [Solirubrobacteraceae bacterium]|jgi:hypothetical protein|nr:BBE domain-containing protein [Solirubrobacteraceae bacterium]
MAWARETFAGLEPVLMEGKYVNCMDDDEEPGSTGAYGAVFEPLRAVKLAYDPENVFRAESEHSAIM